MRGLSPRGSPDFAGQLLEGPELPFAVRRWQGAIAYRRLQQQREFNHLVHPTPFDPQPPLAIITEGQLVDPGQALSLDGSQGQNFCRQRCFPAAELPFKPRKQTDGIGVEHRELRVRCWLRLHWHRWGNGGSQFVHFS